MSEKDKAHCRIAGHEFTDKRLGCDICIRCGENKTLPVLDQIRRAQQWLQKEEEQ